MAWCDVVEPRTLRECRIALGKSQAACAALLGVSPESYRTWDGIVKLSGIAMIDPQHTGFATGLEPIILGVGQPDSA